MHQDHDLLLIAGLAADDLTPADRTRAEALADTCTECRALRADLLAIADATRALPGIPAPRDFRITPEQAVRLRRTNWVTALLGPFGQARSARPIATAFTTLGLVGVFVAAVLPGMFGGSALTAAPENAGAAGAPAATAAPAPQLGPGVVATAVPGDAGFGTKDNVEASAAPLTGQGGGDNRDLSTPGVDRLDTPASAPGPTNLLLIGSVALVATGIVLFGLSVAGRRLR